MKQLLNFTLLLCTVGILMAGCKKNKEAEPEPATGPLRTLGVATHMSFDNDQVIIYIDGQPVLDEKITSNPSLGLAKSLRLERNAGQHSIKVVVNGSAMKSTNFTTTDDLYIGIDYNEHNHQISFQFRSEPFVYD